MKKKEWKLILPTNKNRLSFSILNTYKTREIRITFPPLKEYYSQVDVVLSPGNYYVSSSDLIYQGEVYIESNVDMDKITVEEIKKDFRFNK